LLLSCLMMSRLTTVNARIKATRELPNRDGAAVGRRMALASLARRSRLLNECILLSLGGGVCATLLLAALFASQFFGLRHVYGAGILFFAATILLEVALFRFAQEAWLEPFGLCRITCRPTPPALRPVRDLHRDGNRMAGVSPSTKTYAANWKNNRPWATRGGSPYCTWARMGQARFTKTEKPRSANLRQMPRGLMCKPRQCGREYGGLAASPRGIDRSLQPLPPSQQLLGPSFMEFGRCIVPRPARQHGRGAVAILRAVAAAIRAKPAFVLP
jgi:Protein of unknown function (DUF2721)